MMNNTPPFKRPPARILNNHLREKPKGPQNTKLNHGINQVKFNWYCAAIGWCVASLFWGICFRLWGG